jgi:predicted enzyme related to lactoylglutathione lyase
MNRVVHFEISADDPERASGFYRSVFGWKIINWEGPVDYWLVTTGEKGTPGIDGGIKHRPEPDLTTVVTVEVESVDETLDKITAGGGVILMPKTEIPGVGYHAYFRDTEGNVVGLMENL